MLLSLKLISEDARQKTLAYHGLAKNYLDSNNPLFAVHCQVLSDMYAAVRSIISNKGDLKQFYVQSSSLIKKSTIPNTSPQTALRETRHVIVELLTDRQKKDWETFCTPLDMFPNYGELVLDIAETFKAARLGDLKPEEFVQYRRQEQANLLLAAEQANLNGDLWEVNNYMYQADFAGFEAWLVQRSINIGDDHLITCTISWDLAILIFENITEFPQDLKEAVFFTRSRLGWVAGPQEANSLAQAFANPGFYSS